jgi:hypothetical protein
MSYANNFLPSITSRWSLYNAYVTNGTIHINAGGRATVMISKLDIAQVPALCKLVFQADIYTNSCTPTSFIKVHIVYADNTSFYALLPFCNNNVSEFSALLNMTGGEYNSFEVTIYSSYNIAVSAYTMLLPVTDIDSSIAAVQGELPNILYEYNKQEIEIGAAEESLGIIAAYLYKNTDLNGHVSIYCVASEDAIVTVRIRSNDITELYMPVDYTVKTGVNVLTLPHAYLGRKAGNHTFVVTAQISSGTALVKTRGLLYTIDGNTLAKRLYDVDAVLSDITVKKGVDETDLTAVYVVGIDGNQQAVLRRRPYGGSPDQAWEPVVVMEHVVDISTEFDGIWGSGASGITYHTLEFPYVFYVDISGTLFAQYYTDTANKVQLDIDVLKVKAVRGWSNVYELTIDQGLVVFYIKEDGTLWYRNLCYITDESRTWDTAVQVTEFTSTGVHLSAFRTNDYRLGVSVEDDQGDIYTYITERCWAGMAVEPAYITAACAFAPIDVIELDQLVTDNYEWIDTAINEVYIEVSLATDAITVEECYVVDRNTIMLNMSRAIESLTDMAQFFTITGKTIAGLTYGNDSTEIVITLAQNMAYGVDYSLTYTYNYYGLEFLNSLGEYVRVPSFASSVTGKPTEIGYGTENVTTSVTVLPIDVLQVFYSYGYGTESVTADVIFDNIVVTHVGSKPL